MAESLSIEETNALRRKLGLPELQEEEDANNDTNVIDPEQEAYENYERVREEEKKAAKEAQIRERLEQSKVRKLNRERWKGKGLADEEDESAQDWIKRMQKKDKELAAKRAKELEQQDESFANAHYDSQNLAGLKVVHDLSDFNEGDEMILTLKDRQILDEEDEDEDELMNIQIEEKEKRLKNLENKRKKPGYNPYEEHEFTLGGDRRKILQQYDEEKKPDGFRIGEKGMVDTAPQEMSVSDKVKMQTLSFEKMKEIEDYYTLEEDQLRFKKPASKKKKKRKLRQKESDDTLTETSSNVQKIEQVTESEERPGRHVDNPEASYVDDDDLQSALARSRERANKERRKKMKMMTPEEIARTLAESNQYTEEQSNQGDSGEGLVISEISEFLGSFSNAQEQAPVEQQDSHMEDSLPPRPEPSSPDTSEMQIDEVIQEETSENDNAVEDMKDKLAAPIIEEPLVSRGMAATLSLLTQKGVISAPTEEQRERERRQAEHFKWQTEMRQREVESERGHSRSHDRSPSTSRNRDRARDREQERDRERDEQRRLREYAKQMENYKPVIKLEHVDDTGRVMNPKEAFKFMSHKFHGKASGMGKMEKRLQKLDEERKQNMAGSTDILNLKK